MTGEWGERGWIWAGYRPPSKPSWRILSIKFNKRTLYSIGYGFDFLSLSSLLVVAEISFVLIFIFWP